MEITEKCSEATLSLIGEDEAERVETVVSALSLGRLLDRSDDDWPLILHNIRKARQVWGRIGELLWRERAETTVSTNVYRSVVQTVLLIVAETWVLTETMSQRIEGAHVNF